MSSFQRHARKLLLKSGMVIIRKLQTLITPFTVIIPLNIEKRFDR